MSVFTPRNPFDEEAPEPGSGDFVGPDLREEQRLGLAARMLIESEPYQLVTTAMQERIWAGFKACPLRDAEGLHQLRVMLKCVTEMHELLTEVAETGRMAAIQLTEQQEADT